MLKAQVILHGSPQGTWGFQITKMIRQFNNSFYWTGILSLDLHNSLCRITNSSLDLLDMFSRIAFRILELQKLFYRIAIRSIKVYLEGTNCNSREHFVLIAERITFAIFWKSSCAFRALVIPNPDIVILSVVVYFLHKRTAGLISTKLNKNTEFMCM